MVRLKNGIEPAGSRALRILVVDDHPDTAHLMALLLGRWGHQVTTATSVAEGLTAAEAGEFDCLISDIHLPDASGWDLMSRLRGKPSLTGIALSGSIEPSDLANSQRAGFARHLAKPVNLEELRSILTAIGAGQALN